MSVRREGLGVRAMCVLGLVLAACNAGAPAVCHASYQREGVWVGSLIGVDIVRFSAMEVGLTGGYTLASGLFLGGEVSTNAFGYEEGFLAKTHDARRMHRSLAHVGYDIAIDKHWRLRGQLSLGAQSVRNRHDGELGDGSYYTDTGVAGGFGAALVVRLGWFFAGLGGQVLSGPAVRFGDRSSAGGIALRALGGVAF